MQRRRKQFDVPDIKDIGPSIRRLEDDIATSEAIARFKQMPGHAEVVRKLDKLVARLRGRKRKGTGKARRVVGASE